jgi:hypothetical protein
MYVAFSFTGTPDFVNLKSKSSHGFNLLMPKRVFLSHAFAGLRGVFFFLFPFLSQLVLRIGGAAKNIRILWRNNYPLCS